MIVFEFHNNKYSFPEKLSEITLGKFIEYGEKVEVKKPESLKEFEENTDEKDRVKQSEQIESGIIINEWLPFFVSFIQFWTDMPKNIAAEIPVHEAFWLYSLINKNINAFEYDSKKLGFSVQGEDFLYPKQPISKFSKDTVEYLKGSRIIEVIEAFQFELYAEQLSKSKFGAMPYIIGILCRKENEPLPIEMEAREDFISERAETMKLLPLDEALNFSFFLPTLNNILKSDSDLSGKLHLQKTQNPEHTAPKFGNVTGGLL